MFQLIFRILLMATFAIWFGGFTFYTSVVVPIGTDVLGSSRTQGFVTQQVTNWLNLVGGVALAFGLLDLIFGYSRRSRKANRALAIVLSILILCWILLLVLHPMLDGMLEPEHEYVTDEGRFYQIHRAYLWASTIQWLVCWFWLVMIIRDWTASK